MSSTRRRPHGKDAVKKALIKAAAELFSERSAAAVSVRDIAKRAGVNHALLHRHFGTKDALRKAVMDDLAAEMGGAMAKTLASPAGPAAAMHAVGDNVGFVRILARALLDGESLASIRDGFPVLEALREQAKHLQAAGIARDDVDARMMAGLTLAVCSGWLVFEPFILRASGLEGEPEQLRVDMLHTFLQLLAKHPDLLPKPERDDD